MPKSVEDRARRCVHAGSLPSSSEASKILGLDTKRVPALTVTEFLNKSKLGQKLETACKLKAERDRRDKKNAGLSLEVLTKRNKEDFGRQARSYVTNVLSEAQGHIGLTSDIVKGLGAFDLNVILEGNHQQGESCARQLFSNLQLRGHFAEDQETQCLEEYQTLVEEFLRLYSEMAQPTLFIQDTVDLLMEQPLLRSNPLLFKMFQLACLCLDEPFSTLPPVKFSSINTEDPTCRHIDVILPVQSYFKNIPYCVEAVTTDDLVAKFLRYESVYGELGVSDTYCPWAEVDRYGRGQMLKALDGTVLHQRGAEFERHSGTSSARSAPKTLGVPKSKKRTSRMLTETEVSRSVGDLLASSSKS